VCFRDGHIAADASSVKISPSPAGDADGGIDAEDNVPLSLSRQATDSNTSLSVSQNTATSSKCSALKFYVF
jgi:hypothetical protein